MSPDPAPGPDALDAAARALGGRLRERGWRLATAESCTGGLVGHVVTQLPGASDWYVGGVVSYSNHAKTALLGVASELIAAHGAVSAEVAAGMAQGMLDRSADADVAVAVTGIAGPDGGTPEKPVGLTYVAALRRGGTARIERSVWPHDRDGNKRASALAALTVALAVASE